MKKILVVICSVMLSTLMLCHIETVSPQSSHYIILCFDDDQLDFPNDQAVTIMDSYGYHGVAMAVVDWISETNPVWSHIIQEGWEIGCHSWTHPDLNAVSASQLIHETADAKAWLEQVFGVNVISFAYSFSTSWDNVTVLQALENAGFVYARDGCWPPHWNGQRSLQVDSTCASEYTDAYYTVAVQLAISNALTYGVGVIMFHAVKSTPRPNDWGNLTPDEFRYCLNQIRNAGLTPITFKEWDQMKYSSSPPPQPVQYDLTVNSAYGSPTPSVGDNFYNDSSTVTCSVSSPVVLNGVSYTSTGWTGTGSVPSTGSSISTTFTITQNSTLTWNWMQTPAPTYMLNVNVVGQGTVTENASQPYVSGQTVSLTATASSDYIFQGWTGDITGTADPATLSITKNMTVTATFTQNPQPPAQPSQITINITFEPFNFTMQITLTNGTAWTAPTSITMSQGTWTFNYWSDGSTSPSRTFTSNGTYGIIYN